MQQENLSGVSVCQRFTPPSHNTKPYNQHHTTHPHATNTLLPFVYTCVEAENTKQAAPFARQYPIAQPPPPPRCQLSIIKPPQISFRKKVFYLKHFGYIYVELGKAFFTNKKI